MRDLRNQLTTYTGCVVDAPADTVLGFLNTIDVEEDTDVMADLASWRAWVQDSLGLPATAETHPKLASARELRALLRDQAMGITPAEPTLIPVTVRIDPLADASVEADTVIGRIAADVLRLTLEGRWSRIKVCPADDCRWAFYDESKNRSRQWCSMRVCGNRAKARNHRLRTTDGGQYGSRN